MKAQINKLQLWLLRREQKRIRNALNYEIQQVRLSQIHIEGLQETARQLVQKEIWMSKPAANWVVW